MITPTALLEANYKKFHDPTKVASLGDWYCASYQKNVHDASGIRYHITISHSIIPASHNSVGQTRALQHSYSSLVQFHRKGTTVNVEMLYHDETIEQIEAFFAEMWETMTLNYYEEGPADRQREY